MFCWHQLQARWQCYSWTPWGFTQEKTKVRFLTFSKVKLQWFNDLKTCHGIFGRNIVQLFHPFLLFLLLTTFQEGLQPVVNQASLGATWSTGNSFSTCSAHGHAVDVSMAFKAALTWKAFDSIEWTWLCNCTSDTLQFLNYIYIDISLYIISMQQVSAKQCSKKLLCNLWMCQTRVIQKSVLTTA